MIANHQLCTSAYLRLSCVGGIQHQFLSMGCIWSIETATMLVIMGKIQVHTQMTSFFHRTDKPGRDINPVTVRSVSSMMASMVKSTACAVSCAKKPLVAQAEPGCSSCVST